MSERAGIPATLVDERSLEDKIEFQLNQVLADPEITNPYTDRQDKQNVLRRKLILAAIATIIQHQNEKMVDGSKGATVSLDGEVSPFSELMAAWRDLQHDTKRLNDGLKGELVAAPLSRESIERQGVVSADRKFRIMHYVAAELYTRKDRQLFPSKAAFERYSAKILNSSVGSMKVERSKIKQGKNEGETSLFYELLKTTRSLSAKSGGHITPFQLFLPAPKALSNDKITKLSRKVN